MADCTNIFENLNIEITEDYAYVDGPPCIEQIRDLMQRDDFNLEVSRLINNKLIEVCEQLQEVEQTLDECCGYYDYNLGDFVI